MKEEGHNLWQGYQAVHEAIIQFYMPLVNLWAKRMIRKTRRVSLKDLQQEGVLAILLAIKTFEPINGVHFSDYTAGCIRKAICTYPGVAHHISQYRFKQYRRILHIHDNLMQKLERKPTMEEISQEAKLTPRQIEKAFQAINIAFTVELTDYSLEELMSNTGWQDNRILMNQLLTHLNHKEKTILVAHYVQGQSDKEISQNLGPKPGTVKKIRHRTLRKLRRLLE